jgi:hypothetical protein
MSWTTGTIGLIVRGMLAGSSNQAINQSKHNIWTPVADLLPTYTMSTGRSGMVSIPCVLSMLLSVALSLRWQLSEAPCLRFLTSRPVGCDRPLHPNLGLLCPGSRVPFVRDSVEEDVRAKELAMYLGDFLVRPVSLLGGI